MKRRERALKGITKTCGHCSVPQDLSEYYNRGYCRSCVAAKHKEKWAREGDAILAHRRKHYSVTPEKRRKQKNHMLLGRYGISIEKFEAILAGQDGKCAICKRLPPRAVLDHDHATGKVRGILCDPCNFALGALREDVAVFAACIQYLQLHKEQETV